MPRGLHRYQQSGDLHFLTFSCYHRLPYLKRPEAACLFESALEAVRKRYGLAVLGYVVMPEHVHMLVNEPKRCRLDRFIQAPGAPSKLCLGGKARSHPSLCHPSPVADRSYPRYPSQMRSLRYSINVTSDGCCDHREMTADEDLHRNATKNLEQADALLFGRVTYEMMEAGWRPPAPPGTRPAWMEPFARTIDAAKKYVVSSTLTPDRVDWNAELVRGDLETAVRALKQEPGKGLFVGGLKLPLVLAEMGLIDEYEFVVHPRLAGHGPTLFAGLSKPIDLRLVSRLEFRSGAVAMRYEPRR
jgi:dihydrofolate reductase/REP element-mobilizing transposase RayT